MSINRRNIIAHPDRSTQDRPNPLGLVLHNVSLHCRSFIAFWSNDITRTIAFRYIPNSLVTRPVEAIWVPLVQKPFFRLPYYTRLAMGWLALLGIVFGSAFGFGLTAVRNPLLGTAFLER